MLQVISLSILKVHLKGVFNKFFVFSECCSVSVDDSFCFTFDII